VRLLRGRRIAFVSSAFGTPRHTCEHGREQLAAFGLGAEGFQVEALALERDLEAFDVLILNRVPATPALVDCLHRARGRGAALIGDLDDLLLDEETILSLPYFRAGAQDARDRLRTLAAGLGRTFALCSHVLCYTAALERELCRFGHRPLRITICASAEMTALARQAIVSTRRDPRFVTIGYAGGHPGHAVNLKVASSALARLLDQEPAARFALLGGLEPPPELANRGERVVRVPYVDWRELPREIRRLDVAIAPLADVAFNAGKSHLKYVDAALCGVPLVASPVGQLGETLRDGVTGRFAATAEEWHDRLQELVRSAALREAMGERARRDVLRRFTTDACAPRFVRALGQALRST
jgi:glycosyltransferase involved in cell wall biosynthesis